MMQGVLLDIDEKNRKVQCSAIEFRVNRMRKKP